MILYDTERSTYSYSMHADNLKGCTRVRQRICEHKESTIKSIGQELVELVLVLLVLQFPAGCFLVGHNFALGVLAGPSNRICQDASPFKCRQRRCKKSPLKRLLIRYIYDRGFYHVRPATIGRPNPKPLSSHQTKKKKKKKKTSTVSVNRP